MDIGYIISKNTEKTQEKSKSSVGKKAIEKADLQIKTTDEAKQEYVDLIREQVKKIFDPTNGMSEAEKQRYYNRIMQKLKSGKKLTAEEMRFIQINYPEMYPDVVRVQVQRESLENQVKHCRSKEQVNDVCMRAASMISDNDPLAEQLYVAYKDVEEEFKKTQEYSELPDTNKEANEKNNKSKASSKSSVQSSIKTSTNSYFMDDNCLMDDGSLSAVDFSA